MTASDLSDELEMAVVNALPDVPFGQELTRREITRVVAECLAIIAKAYEDVLRTDLRAKSS